ncbi:MAG: DNA lyase, partial [Thermoplasmata archaeon]
ANRLGVVHTKTPEQTEIALRKVVPEQYWIPLNPLLVQHGQNLCRPRRPLCPQCPILDLCVTGLALRAGRRPPRKEDALVRARKKAARRPPPRPPIRRTARARRAR